MGKSKHLINNVGRVCSKCYIFKPWSEYNRNRAGAKGHSSSCRACYGIRVRIPCKVDEWGRECSTCRKYKLWDEYYKSEREKTGCTSRCKVCDSVRRNGKPPLIYHKDDIGRECIYCKKHLPWNNFGISKKGYNGRVSACKSCIRKRAIARKYDIPIEQYDKMLSSQNGQCAICGKETDYFLHVDHDHNTGNVRGLLCQECNLAIGLLQDNPSILRSGAEYLEKHNQP